MAKKPNPSVAPKQRGYGRMHHPRNGQRPVPRSFVASGTCTDAVCQVIGRLMSNGKVLCYGMPIPTVAPNGWALYFKRVHPGSQNLPCTLDVFGVIINPQGVLEVVSIDSQPVTIRGGSYGANIEWPYANENDLCPSNFVPYGAYDTAGTITADLSGGHTANATYVQQDPSEGFWSATFDTFDPPQDPCTVTVSLDGVAQDDKPGLQFQSC